MGRFPKILKQPCSAVRQAWKDYKVGRMVRKNEKGVERLQCNGKQCEGKQCEGKQCKGKQCNGTQCKGNQCKGNQPRTQPAPSSPQTGWKFKWAAEFPWRFQQIVHEESNWRGTWILEAKDMQGISWGTELVPDENGPGFEYQRKPTKQLPFTPEMQEGKKSALIDGGQDDLMVWLGKR